MLNKVKKPYVIYIAEIIYIKVSTIKKQNPKINTENAIKKFINTKLFDELSSGKLHDNWFKELKKNDYIDKESSEKIPQETLKLLEIQRDMTIKQLVKIPNLYETKNNSLINLSKRGYEFIWRMCESFELWIIESKQDKDLVLKIIK